nr:hypothetical protein [uncultured Flavobacterium sp.]
MTSIRYFQTLLHTAFALYFGQEAMYSALKEVPLPEEQLLPDQEMSWEEKVVLLLALMPHSNPETLDLFLIQNKNLNRTYTEFGGWQGISHNGFLPTGQTAAFLLGVAGMERTAILEMFAREHWFYKKGILHLEGQGSGEPFLSGRLIITEEALDRVKQLF